MTWKTFHSRFSMAYILSVKYYWYFRRIIFHLDNSFEVTLSNSLCAAIFRYSEEFTDSMLFFFAAILFIYLFMLDMKLSYLIPWVAVESIIHRLFSRQSLWCGNPYLDQTCFHLTEIHRPPASSGLGVIVSSECHACLMLVCERHGI